MALETIRGRCLKCLKRRALRLAYVDASGELWFCRGCRIAFNREVASTEAFVLRMYPEVPS